MAEKLSQKEQFLEDHGKFNIEVSIEYNEVKFLECYFPADGKYVFETLEEAKIGAKFLYGWHKVDTIKYMQEQDDKIFLTTEDAVQRLT